MKRIWIIFLAVLLIHPVLSYAQGEVLISKKFLQKRLHNDHKLYEWLIKNTYIHKISSSKGRFNQSIDIEKFKTHLKKEFPNEADQFISFLDSAQYQEDLRNIIYDHISKVKFERTYTVRIEFNITLDGNIINIQVIPISKKIPDQFLKDVTEAVQKISLLKPLPEAIRRYHRGFFSKDLFKDRFDHGEQIYDWLIKKNYLMQSSDGTTRPSLILTGEFKKDVQKNFPKQQMGILSLMKETNNQYHKFRIEITFDRGRWLGLF